MKKKLLFYYPLTSTFIQKDIRLLEDFNVKEFEFNTKSKFFSFLKIPLQFIHLLRHFRNTRVIISYFAGYHTILPFLFSRIFKIPNLLIIAGTESHKFPQINYGNFAKPIYGWFTKKSFQLATHVAPVDESLVISEYTYDRTFPSPQGYKAFVGNTTVPYTVIYYGYDHKRFHPLNINRIPNSFLTIARSIDNPEFYRKGIDLILQVAEEFPKFKFTIIANREKPISLPKNVQLISAMTQDDLIKVCNEHEFYFQLSIAEGFPNALCEAMLCGCIPIGSVVFGIPKIIDDAGFILRERNIDLLVEIMELASIADKKVLSEKAIKHIRQNFPEEKRKRGLSQLIEKLSKSDSLN